jgi:hypothetical protein
LDRLIFGERPVDRRRGVELDVRAQVVAAVLALLAHAAGALRLDGDALTHPIRRHPGTDGDDGAGRLVPKDHGRSHHEVADASIVEVVHVGAADPDRGDADEHLVGVESRDGDLFDLGASLLDEHICPHGLGRHS